MLSAWIVEIIDYIGMTLLAGPYIVDVTQFPGPGSGVTGLAVLAESHIAVHTWPELASVQMDIYSCKEYDVRQVRDKVVVDFGIVSGGNLALKRPLQQGALQILMRKERGRWVEGI